MLKSMTGFGSASGQVNGIDFAIEVKSVNNRYLKVSMRLPEGLQAIEPVIEQKLKECLTRGTVSLNVRMKLPDESCAYRVNTAALNNYVEQLRVLEVEANPMLRVDLGSVLQLPGVCEPPELDELVASATDGLLKLLEEAVSGLMTMRTREGEALVKDLLGRADEIEALLESIAGNGDELLKLYHEKLKQRVEKLLNGSGVEMNEDTLSREVAIFAERCDIAEEVSRLGTHLKEFRKVCLGDEPMGRKLDFMAQEMLREANTIASKSSDADVARSVVDIKTAIDRIKEQAANVE